MILIYTFKTFPWTFELESLASHMSSGNVSENIFIFKKLKEDFERFCKEVKDKKPEWIIGIAKGRRSIWESETVNKFNKGKIIKGGIEKYNLHVPGDSPFPVHEIPWTTFCNWTAYKVQDFLITNNLDIKFSFLHIEKKEIGLLFSQRTRVKL